MQRLFKPKLMTVRRGEWNIFLLATLCALLVVSPVTGASLMSNAPVVASTLAASSLASSVAATPGEYRTVLWWLHSSTSGKRASRSESHILATLHDPHFKSLLTTAEQALRVADGRHYAEDQHLTSVSTAHKWRSVPKSASNQAAATFPPVSSVDLRVSDLTQYALTDHEAAVMSGVRLTDPLE